MEKLSAERSRTYRADVNNGCQLQDVFDRRLGGIQFWGLEQGVVFGHDAWRCNYKEGFKDSELERERKKEESQKLIGQRRLTICPRPTVPIGKLPRHFDR